ncbi:MAG: MBL fold metallo-hydrolase [Acidimicrobiales bacterium]
MSDVTIEWINHAGYMLEHNDVGLVVDPWLDGAVFDSGWELLAPTKFSSEDWDRATALWLSHEHPDHFHPPSLASIPTEVRDRLEVLFQETGDQRVIDWCSTRFGAVREMSPGQWVPVGDGIEALCGPHDNGDSWLAVRTPAGLVLNLNDCVVSTAAECDQIMQQTGRPDVLLSQFSYANWTGNPGDKASMAAAAEEKISWLLTQIDGFRPRVTIPFASFVWFGHEDNVHLNEGALPIAEVIGRLRGAGAPVQLLYPGDRWAVGPPDDALTERAIARYERDRRWRSTNPPRSGRTVPMEELIATADAWAAELRTHNGPAVRLLPSARIHLRDHNATYRLDSRGLRPAEIDPDHCDLQLRSDALDAALSVSYGGRTLDINGRFAVPPNGHYSRFKALATLAAFNTRDESWREVLLTIGRRMLARAKSLTPRRHRSRPARWSPVGYRLAGAAAIPPAATNGTHRGEKAR